MSEDINKSGPTPLPPNVIRKTSEPLIPFVNVRTNEKTNPLDTRVAQAVFEARSALVQAKMLKLRDDYLIDDAIIAVDQVLIALEMIGK